MLVRRSLDLPPMPSSSPQGPPCSLLRTLPTYWASRSLAFTSSSAEAGSERRPRVADGAATSFLTQPLSTLRLKNEPLGILDGENYKRVI